MSAVVGTERLTWAEICVRHSGHWLLLVEIEDEQGHWSRIRTARVVDSDRSVRALLDRNGIVGDSTLIHTSGRPLCVTPAFSWRSGSRSSVAKFCHDTPDPSRSGRTRTDEGPD